MEIIPLQYEQLSAVTLPHWSGNMLLIKKSAMKCDLLNDYANRFDEHEIHLLCVMLCTINLIPVLYKHLAMERISSGNTY